MADTLALNLTCTITEGSTSQTSKRIFTASDTSITEDTNLKFTVPANTTDHLVDLGEVTPLEHFVLSFNGPVSVRLNDDTAPQLALSGTAPFLCFSGADITEIYISNSGSSAVTVELIGGYSA